MKNIKLSLINAMNRKVETILKNSGAVVVYESDTLRKYILETKAGNLFVSIELNPKTTIASIYCMFENEQLAALHLGGNERLNKHSGKFNFHGTDTDICFFLFEKELSNILTNEPILF